MQKRKHIFSGFGKPGEKVTEKNGVYMLEGVGTDIGCNLVLRKEINNPSILELEVKGVIDKHAEWVRLRIEIFDREKPNEPATSFEGEYLNLDLDEKRFSHLSFPILGIVRSPFKVQFMVVGPAKSRLEIRNVSIR